MALLATLDSWMGEVNKGSVVGALLIDLFKAFDTVPHQQLLVELAAIGCGQSTLNLFQSYMTGREQRVKQGQKITNWCKVSRGCTSRLQHLSSVFQYICKDSS